MKNWKNILKDEPCFLLGCGPSLEVNHMHKLKGLFTIGINRIFLAYDPIILFWQDKMVWLERSQVIENTNAIKLCPHVKIKDKYDHVKKRTLKKLIQNKDNRKDFVECAIQIEDKIYVDKGHQDKNGKFVFYRSNKSVVSTGALAVQLAVYMGCSPIILVGMDCCKRGVKTNFYGRNKHHSWLSMDICKRSMNWLKQEVDRTKIDIINCGDNGLWKKYKLSEMIKQYNDKKSTNEKLIKKLL